MKLELTNQDVARIIQRRGHWRWVEDQIGLTLSNEQRVDLITGERIGVSLPVITLTPGERIWLCRRRIGMSQQDLAKLTGLSRWLIRQAETDQDELTAQTLLQVHFKEESDNVN